MCIEAQDLDTLVRTPGVGRKTAERLVVEMRDRVKGFGDSGLAVLPTGGTAEAAIGPQARGFQRAGGVGL